MRSSALDIAREVVLGAGAIRQSGTSTALLIGSGISPNSIIVAADSMQKRDLEQRAKIMGVKVKVITLDSVGGGALRGQVGPLLFEKEAVARIVEGLFTVIENERRPLDKVLITLQKHKEKRREL